MSESGSDGDRPMPSRPTSRARRIGGAGARAAPPPVGGGGPGRDAEGSVASPTPDRGRKATRVTLEKAPREAAATPSPPSQPQAAVPRWLPAVLTALGAAAAVAFLVLGIIGASGVWWGNTNAIRDERGAVLAAAKSCMATMNTYDYRKLDEAERAGLACTTGALTDQYRTAMEKVIKPQAVAIQFTQTAQVLNAGIEGVSADGTQWTVLVFGQLTTTNSATATNGAGTSSAATPSAATPSAATPSAATPSAATPSAPPGTPPTTPGTGSSGAPALGSNAPRLDLFSARAVLEKVDGRWRVANYEYSPSS